MNKDCEHIQDFMDEYLAGELSPEQERKVIEHVDSCPYCAEAFRKEKQLRDMFSAMERKKPPPELEAAVMRRLEQEKAETKPEKRGSAWILTIPRIRIAMGAAAAVIIAAVGIHIMNSPDRLAPRRTESTVNEFTYDPSNGTMATGNVYRVSQGVEEKKAVPQAEMEMSASTKVRLDREPEISDIERIFEKFGASEILSISREEHAQSRKFSFLITASEYKKLKREIEQNSQFRIASENIKNIKNEPPRRMFRALSDEQEILTLPESRTSVNENLYGDSAMPRFPSDEKEISPLSEARTGVKEKLDSGFARRRTPSSSKAPLKSEADEKTPPAASPSPSPGITPPQEQVGGVGAAIKEPGELIRVEIEILHQK